MTLVEVLVGAVTLALCAAPILGSVSWMRLRAAETTTQGLVTNALAEQISLVQSLGRATALSAGTTKTSQSLGGGVTLAITRTVASIAGKPRLYDVRVDGAWTARAGGGARSLTLETYVFSPDN